MSGLTRRLTLLGVLAGVFAMHALTMNHDPAMAGMDSIASMTSSGAGHTSAATGVAAVADNGGAPSGHVRMSDQVTAEMAAVTEFASASNLMVSAHSNAGSHQMSDVCVAVLAASLALVGLALMLCWLRSARFAPWAWQLLPLQLSPLSGRSPPWLAPSLSKLCVLRT
ncbi:hypothetical protein GCM10029976_031580 [Kribbella albertanoniae]